jgi:hypothetical protein
MMRQFFIGVNNLRDDARQALPDAERTLLFGDGECAEAADAAAHAVAVTEDASVCRCPSAPRFGYNQPTHADPPDVGTRAGGNLMADTPLVGIVMGSKSDMDVMQQCADQLDELAFPTRCSWPVRTATRSRARLGEHCG